ncbi:MAG: YtxH domain-containing protein [Byssovorax sp.]
MMSSTLNDTLSAAKQILASANTEATHAVDSAKHAVGSATSGAKQAMGSAKDGADHAVTSARATWFDGIKAVTGMVAMIRSLQADDALGWVGLSRRRSPVATIGIFSAGMVLGAGAALLFAPMSGEETRRRIFGSLAGIKSEAKSTLDHAAAEVKSDVAAVGSRIEEVASHAKDAVIEAEHKVEDGAVALKDLASSKVDAAVQAVKGAAATATSQDPTKAAVTEVGNGKSKANHPS